MINRETIFSPCRKYRYTLWRDWTKENFEISERHGNNSDKFVQFIGLNPSTADETQDDPTIRRCIGFAKSWGYGAFCMTNLFAFRATDPEEMKASPEHGFAIVENYKWIDEISKEAGKIVCAWGVHGAFCSRGAKVRVHFNQLKMPIYHLGLTRGGYPKHPLYLKSDLTPILWEP